jgi:hypothetical protein
MRACLQVLFELCRFRNGHEAFNGTFELLDTVEAARTAIELGDAAVTAYPGEVHPDFLTSVGDAAGMPERGGAWCDTWLFSQFFFVFMFVCAITIDRAGMAALRLQCIASSVLNKKSNLQHVGTLLSHAP